MEHIFAELHKKVENVGLYKAKGNPVPDSGSQGKKEAPSQRHIFYDILELTCSNNNSQKLAFTYYFQTYEECLALSRSKMVQMAKDKMEYIDSYLPLNFGERENSALNVIYLPMKAYYLHMVKRHEEALAHLEESILKLELLDAMGVKNARLAILEQTLNCSRVYFDTGDKENALIFAKQLLNKVQAFYYSKEQLTEEDGESMEYYINSLLSSAAKLSKEDFMDTVSRLFSGYSFLDKAGLESAAWGIYLVNLTLCQENEKLLEALNEKFEMLLKTPGMCRTMVLSYLAVLVNTHAYSQKELFSEQISNYILGQKVKVDTFVKIVRSYQNYLTLAA